MALLATDVIRRSVLELEARRTVAQREVMEASTALEALDRELALLKELLRIRESGGIQVPENGVSALTGAFRLGSPSRTGSDTTRVVDAVKAILQEAAQPLPIRVIYDELKNRGIPLPGQGRMVNVIAAITRSDAIARPARGVYALPEWPGLSDQSRVDVSLKRQKRPRRVRRRTRVRS